MVFTGLLVGNALLFATAIARKNAMKKNSEYEKIPRTLKQLDLAEKALNELGKLTWVVTEKIHGANFSFAYENRNTPAADAPGQCNP